MYGHGHSCRHTNTQNKKKKKNRKKEKEKRKNICRDESCQLTRSKHSQTQILELKNKVQP